MTAIASLLIIVQSKVVDQKKPQTSDKSKVKNKSVALEKKKDIKVDSSKLESATESVEKSVVPELRFLAKGVLEGEISLVDQGLAIAIDGQQYPLGYTFISKHKDYRKLQSELSSGSSASLLKRVSVYPEVKLVDNTYIYFFNLVAVAKEIEQGIFAQLKPGEFYLSGLWQHVEFHPAPCLLIYRNVTDNFLGIAAKQPLKRVKSWLKPIHVPVYGLDLTKAFKYNPQAQKNQQNRRKFYSLLATFNDSKFVVHQSSILEHFYIPRYLKASRAKEILAQNQS
jgi:hypothetical protein